MTMGVIAGRWLGWCMSTPDSGSWTGLAVTPQMLGRLKYDLGRMEVRSTKAPRTLIPGAAGVSRPPFASGMHRRRAERMKARLSGGLGRAFSAF